MRKNTRNGSASSRYKSHMALNTSVSHATMKRLRSWKKNKLLLKLRKLPVIQFSMQSFKVYNQTEFLYTVTILGTEET